MKDSVSMEMSGQTDWQLLQAAASHLRQSSACRTDTAFGQLRLAMQCLHAPQRLCMALGLLAASPDHADVASAVAEASPTWQERAVITTTLVQHLVTVLMSSMKVRFIPLPSHCAACSGTLHDAP